MKNLTIILVVFACLSFFNSYGQYLDNDSKRTQDPYKKDFRSLDLSLAVCTHNLSKAQKFINNGTNVNVHRRIFCFPLMDAVLGKDLDMVDLLLKNGAKSEECPDIHPDTFKDYDASHQVEYSGDKTRYTPFYYAIKLNQLEIVKKFCEYGYDVNQKISFSYIVEVVDATNIQNSSYGYDEPNYVKVKRTQFSYPIIFASEFGNSDIFNYLIEKKVDINVKDYNGKNPLMASISANNLEMTNKLLQMGCAANDTSITGFTPLMYAAEVNGINFEIINSLINEGADLNHHNSKNQSAFSLACLNNNQNLALFLIEHGAKGKDSKSEFESNARMNHFLGDYYLAKGDLDSSKGYYLKGKQFYNEALSIAKKEKSKVNAKKAGEIVGSVLLTVAANVAAASVGSMAINSGLGMGPQVSSMYNQVHELNQKMASAIVSKNNPILLYNYKLPPEASLDEQKAFYKNKIKQFEMSITLIDGMLACIEKGLTGEDLNACIESIQISQ